MPIQTYYRHAVIIIVIIVIKINPQGGWILRTGMRSSGLCTHLRTHTDTRASPELVIQKLQGPACSQGSRSSPWPCLVLQDLSPIATRRCPRRPASPVVCTASVGPKETPWPCAAPCRPMHRCVPKLAKWLPGATAPSAVSDPPYSSCTLDESWEPRALPSHSSAPQPVHIHRKRSSLPHSASLSLAPSHSARASLLPPTPPFFWGRISGSHVT